jgi:hypothetical protein
MGFRWDHDRDARGFLDGHQPRKRVHGTKIRRFAAAAFLSLGLGFCATLSARADTAEDFRAGFSAFAIVPHEDVSVGGYGYGERRMNPFKPSNLRNFSFRLFRRGLGTLDPIRVKAAVFLRGGQRLVWVSVDTVGITRDFYEEAIDRLAGRGYRENEIFISATHTHSGPGNVSRNFFWQVAAMDWFDGAFYDNLLQSLETAVTEAESRAVPAELFSLSVNTRGLQVNRRKAGDPVDRKARILLARERSLKGRQSKRKWIGAIANYAIHGTAHGPENLLFSGDIPGAIELELERALDLPVAMLVNGAEGDVAPVENGPAGIQRVAKGFARQVASKISLAARVDPEWKVATAEVVLPAPRLDIRKCTSFDVGKSRGGFSGEKLSKIFGRGQGIVVPLSPWLPVRVKIWKIDLGATSIVTWPGEPTTSVGAELRKVIREKFGAPDAWIFALTNDYHAYFTSPTEFAANTYESCFSLHGAKASEVVLDAYRAL